MTLIRHELRQARKSFLIWMLVIGGFLVICLAIYPEMKKEMDSISSAFAAMGSFSSAFGLDVLDFGTLIGFYGIECGNILGLGGALFAALIGINALAKEEKDGTAEFLLTHPMDRAEVVSAKLAAVLIQIVAMGVGIFLLSVASIAAIGEAVPWTEVILLHTAYFLLQVELACVCFGISACLWRSGLGAGLGLAIGLYFLNIIANLTEQAEFLNYITPFGFADAASIISGGRLDLVKVLIGMGFSAFGIVLAYVRYCRKDIR